MANQRINDLQQKLETFDLVKKDIEKKDERISTLIAEIEQKIQKELANTELINTLEEKLEKSQMNYAKLEVEISNKINSEVELSNEIKTLKDKIDELNKKLREAEKIEDKLLDDLQKIKDEKLKNELEEEKKSEEIIELKKKIKLLRREISKS